MNKKDKETEYQKGITELYEKTQDFGRIDFVKVLFDLKEELKICNNDNEKLYEVSKETIKIWKYVAERELKRFCEYYDRCEKLQQENTQLKQQLKETNNCLNLQISNVILLEKELKDKDEKISKIKSYLETTYTEWFNWKSDIKDILESNKED